MLSAKRKSDNQIVLAYFERKVNAPFLCPECNEEVILKSGKCRVNHFAHSNPLTCRYGNAESESHLRCKMEIYESLKRQLGVEKITLEQSWGPVRSDVSAVIRGVPVAIEVQISSLSLEAIISRTLWYARKGIYVLWLLQWDPKLEANRFTPKLWQKWVHAAYFGRVYCWVKGLEVVSYHFAPRLKSVPRKTWYSKEGKKMSGGGFTRRFTRFRDPIRGNTFNLATDFGPHEGLWWEGGGLKLPDRKLFMEKPFGSDPSWN
jgi:competence protein CoiA